MQMADRVPRRGSNGIRFKRRFFRRRSAGRKGGEAFNVVCVGCVFVCLDAVPEEEAQVFFKGGRKGNSKCGVSNVASPATSPPNARRHRKCSSVVAKFAIGLFSVLQMQ